MAWTPRYDGLQDDQLLARYQGGDSEAGVAILHRYQRLIIGLTGGDQRTKEVHEELQQELRITILAGLKELDMKSCTSLYRWIVNVSKRRVCDLTIRRRAYREEGCARLSTCEIAIEVM